MIGRDLLGFLFLLLGLGRLGSLFRFVRFLGSFRLGVFLAVLFAVLLAFGPGFGSFRFFHLLAFGVAPAVTALFGPGSPAVLGFRLRRGGARRGCDNRREAFDADFQRALDLGVQVQFHFVVAQRANRVFEVDLPLVERDVELVLQFVGNRAGGHRAEHLAVLARLDLDDADELGDALGEFGHGVELVGFAFGAALAQHFDLAFVGLRERYGQALRIQKVARVTGGNLHL